MDPKSDNGRGSADGIAIWLSRELGDREPGFVFDLGPHFYRELPDDAPLINAQVQYLDDGVRLVRRSRLPLSRLALNDFSVSGLELDVWMHDGYFPDCTDGYLFTRDRALVAAIIEQWMRDNWDAIPGGEVGACFHEPDWLPREISCVSAVDGAAAGRLFFADAFPEFLPYSPEPLSKVRPGEGVAVIMDLDVPADGTPRVSVADCPLGSAVLSHNLIGNARLEVTVAGDDWTAAVNSGLEAAATVGALWPLAGLRFMRAETWNQERAEEQPRKRAVQLPLALHHPAASDYTVVIDINGGVSVLERVREVIGLGTARCFGSSVIADIDPVDAYRMQVVYSGCEGTSAHDVTTRYAMVTQMFACEFAVTAIRVLPTEHWLQELGVMAGSFDELMHYYGHLS